MFNLKNTTMIFDYTIKSITVLHPSKPNSTEKDTEKYTMRCLVACIKFRRQTAVKVYQNDGKNSDEYLLQAVKKTVENIDQKITHAKDGRYELSEEELAKLKEYGPDKEDLLFLPCCELVNYKLPVPMLMKYSRELNGHKEGEYVLKPNTEYAKIWTSIQVLCETLGADGEYRSGCRPEDVAETITRNMIPITVAMDKKDVKLDYNELKFLGLTEEVGGNIPTQEDVATEILNADQAY